MPIIGSRGAASAVGFGQRSGASILIDASGGSVEEIGDYRVHTFTANGNFVVNDIAGSLPSPAFIITNGGTPYYNSAVQVDGSGVTPEWQGGAAPTAGNASSNDIYTYTIIKTGDATFKVFAALAQFA